MSVATIWILVGVLGLLLAAPQMASAPAAADTSATLDDSDDGGGGGMDDAGPADALDAAIDKAAGDEGLTLEGPRRGDEPPARAPGRPPGRPPGEPKANQNRQMAGATTAGTTQPGAAGALPPAEVLAGYQFPIEGLPPEAHAAAASWADKIVNEHIKPYTQELSAEREQFRAGLSQQSEWYEQLQQFQESPAYQIGASLADDPALLARVNEFLRGGTSAAPAGTSGRAATGGAGVAGINRADLDPDGQQLYDLQVQSQQEIAALRDQLAQFGEQVGGVRGWAEQTAAEQQRQAAAAIDAASQQQLQGALSEFTQRLGFDPSTYKNEFRKALKHASTVIRSDRAHRAEYRQHYGHDSREPKPDLKQVLEEGLVLAGFGAIAERRRAQAASSARPPGSRRSQPGAPTDLNSIIDLAAQEEGVALS